MTTTLMDVRWYLIVILICISLIIVIMNIFPCAYWWSVYFLWRNVYLDLLPIFQLGFLLLLSYMSCLYILEIKPLLDNKCFLPFCRLSFCFVYDFLFPSQKLEDLIRSHLFRSHLFIFVFISIALEEWPKKTLVWFISENILSMISSITIFFNAVFMIVICTYCWIETFRKEQWGN